MRPPTIPELLDLYAHASDETHKDISTLIGGIVQGYVSQWMWRRTVRKIGRVLIQLQSGERLTASDARLLLTTFTLSVYLGARNAQAGWLAAQRTIAASESLSKRLSNQITTKEQSS